MTDKKVSLNEDPVPANRTKPENQGDRKHRKHGYRGYPNQPGGGAVHIGSGFAGVGSTSGDSGSDTPFIGERTRESVENEEDEEENESR
ncbi:MAG TPA: hypothetical protein VGG65_02880 [Thermoanaerobaculia bacterium]|jgi:hypothetical protein